MDGFTPASGSKRAAEVRGSTPFFICLSNTNRTTAFMAVGGDGRPPKPGVAWIAGEDAGRGVPDYSFRLFPPTSAKINRPTCL
jgi:hypothetical protein